MSDGFNFHNFNFRAAQTERISQFSHTLIEKYNLIKREKYEVNDVKSKMTWKTIVEDYILAMN